MELGEILQEIQRTLELLLKVMAAGHNQISEKLDQLIPSQMREAKLEHLRGESVPVETNPSRE